MKLLIAISTLILAFSTNLFAQQTPLPTVIVHTVSTSDITPTFDLIGRIKAKERVDLLARVSGFLEQRLFVEGSQVTEGQKLFLIEQNQYQIAVKQAEAELLSAKAGLKNAEIKLKRTAQLRQKKAVSESDYDQATADRDQNRAAVLKAEAGLQQAQLDLKYTEIIAPFTGIIGKSNFSEGDLISTTSSALATVVKVDQVYVEMAVSEKLMLDARRDGINLENPPVAPSLVLSDGSKYSHKGEFNFIAPEVDTSTDTIILRAAFPNPKRLLMPGEFVHVEIKRKQAEVGILIPQSAVQRDKTGYYVLQVDNDNNVGQSRVEMGRQIDGQWQVINGLSEGDRVIIEGLQKVKADTKVNAVEG